MRLRNPAWPAGLIAAALAGTAWPQPEAPAGRPSGTGACSEPSAPLALGSAQWNGWGRDVENTRYQPEPAIRAADVPKLALRWAFGYAGSAVGGQPTMVDGRLFVLSSSGRVYSLDAKTGCTYWTFDAAAGTRTAISIGEFAPPRSVPTAAASAPPRRPSSTHRHKQHGASHKAPHSLSLAHTDLVKAPSAAFFGDDAGAVYALDAQRGTLLWKTQVDAHPLARIAGSPTLYMNRLYVAVASNEAAAAANVTYPCCSFRGSVAALDMVSGNVVWKTYLVAEEPKPRRTATGGAPGLGPAGAAVIGAPTIDVKRGLVYVGTGGSLTDLPAPWADSVVALDLVDGRVRWSQQFSRHDQPGAADFTSSPIVRTLPDGKQLILAAQKSGIVYGLDPERGGAESWRTRVSEENEPAGIEWGPAADHRRLYVALSGLAAEPENLGGAVAALDIKTGAKGWYTATPTPACSWGAAACAHAAPQAVTVIPGVAFSGAMDGHLRAYSTIDGKIVWDYDTAKDFPTVNGIKASGGSFDQGGATIVNGVAYINSGYGQRYGQPGNVLLAFSVDGK